MLQEGAPRLREAVRALLNVAVGCLVRPGAYFDSVFLMRLADRMSRARAGVEQVAAIMGTPANKELLAEAGLDCPDAARAGANDLVVAVRAGDPAAVADLLTRLDTFLAAEAAPAASRPRSLDEAVAGLPHADLAVISVPGQYAAREARMALDRGLHVFLFSDNVPLQEEIELKRIASERGLVVMGPDCGTAIIRGTGVGFANAVRRGPIGVVGASGTGMQEVTTLIHRAGSGISHAIGTGSRDPSDAIGGVTTLAAIDALDADRETAVIVIVSKPPQPRVLDRIRERVGRAVKPVVACFLGPRVDPRGALWDVVRTLDEAAHIALGHAGVDSPAPLGGDDDGSLEHARAARATGQRYVRGLFAGGSFCYQAQDVFRTAGFEVTSNAPLEGVARVDGTHRGAGHALIDLGADELTRGRPHPMIDPRLRRDRILTEADDPEVAVLLLDIILGYGCAPDPAGALADAIKSARGRASRRGGELAVVASVTGTDWDAQGLERQIRTLEGAGAFVASSSSEAARVAARMVS